LTAWLVFRSDRHALPHRWTAAYLAVSGLLECAWAADSQEAAYAALALLPALTVELSLTLYHLSAARKGAAHAALLLPFAAAMAAGRGLGYDSRSAGIVLLAWLAASALTSFMLWLPVLKSPVRRQKHDETARNAVIWLIAPTVPLQAFMQLRVSEGGMGAFAFIYLALTGLSLVGFVLFRFVVSARRSGKSGKAAW